MPDVEIYSDRFKTARGKTFFFDVKSNENGRFIKITESIPQGGSQYRRNFITVSEEDLESFIKTARNAQEYLSGETGGSQNG